MGEQVARVAASFAVALLVALSVRAAMAADALTAEDYQWLAANIKIGPNSSLIQGLTEEQKSRLHDLITLPKTSADKKRQDVDEFLTRTTGDSLEDSLKQSEE
jgi:hypothetical protein